MKNRDIKKCTAAYTQSTHSHTFAVRGISVASLDKLEKILKEIAYTGEFGTTIYLEKISGVTYTTTDEYEASEYFAEKLGRELSEAISRLS
jgi:hypothetical protein